MLATGICLLAVLGASRGADRLTNIAALPVYDAGARIGYVGSIDPTGGNADWDWGDRQDENGEWILFEDKGAGCIFNFTQHRTKRLKTADGKTRQEFPVPTYRFYFDGAKTPQFEIRPDEFGTKAPFLDPLAGSFVPDLKTADFRIVRSFVPMEYRTSAKVTSTVRLKGRAGAGGGWGHVTYHHYDSPEGLTTFDGKNDGAALKALCSRPLELGHDGEAAVAPFELATGARRAIFAASGRSALVRTRLRVGGFASAADFAKDLWIVCSFDGRTTVEAPVGTFFGCEMPAHAATRGLALLTFDTQSEPGVATLENRFPMPFFKGAEIALENRGATPLAVSGDVRTNAGLDYDPKTTGLFTASAYLPPTRNVAGWNARIGALVGRGQMVYGTFSLRDATVRGCEGDVRCFIDGESTPRVQSDGSESWGSWGWGFSRPPQVQPFAAYDAPVADNSAWSQVRLLVGDSYPFASGLRFEVEHGDCNDLAGSASSGQVFGYVLP